MNDRVHRYELDIKGMMSELEERLSDRGYRSVGPGDGDTWIFETQWGHGAAYGEIGSLLYGLVADKLREID